MLAFRPPTERLPRVVGWGIYRIVIGISGLWHRDSQTSILRNCRVSCRTKTRLFDALLMIGGEAS